MANKFFWDILDDKRLKIIPFFTNFKDQFYLAGGTALALQLGHRDSIDFDFFSTDSFSTTKLSSEIERIFIEHSVAKVQESKNTLTVIIDSDIKISFFTYNYPLIKPLLDEKYFKIASIPDIACMKFSAITSRSVLKDYVDIYCILHHFDLETLLNFCAQKFPTIDTNLILKSLVYFDDIQFEPINYKHLSEINFATIKKYLVTTAKTYLDHQK